MKLDEIDWGKIPVVTKTGTDPAIEVTPDAAAYSLEVPAGKVWRVETARMSFVASGDAANRSMYMKIYDAGDQIMFLSVSGVVITAGLTKAQSWCTGSLEVTTGRQYGIHLPPMLMPEGWYLRVGVSNFDAVAAGDNAASLIAYVREAPA